MTGRYLRKFWLSRVTRVSGTLGLAAAGVVVGCTGQPTGPHAAIESPARDPLETQQVSQTIGPGGELFQQVGGITQQMGGGGVSQQLSWPFSGGPMTTIGSGGTSTVISQGGGTSTVVSSGGGTAFASSTTRTGNREEIVQTYGITGNRTLDVANMNGPIALRRSMGPNLEVRIVKEAMGDPQDLGKVNVSSSIGQALALRTMTSDPGARVRVSLDIAVPGTVTLGTIETSEGNIEVSGIQGGVLSARGGTIRMN